MAGPRQKTFSWYWLGDFIITRYPYCNAVLMLLLFAERAKHDRHEGYPRQYIYGTIGTLFILGTMMAFKMQKSLGSLLCTVHMLVHSYLTHTSKNLHFGEWLSMRMVTRNLAVMGAYLILASRQPEHLSRRSNVHFLYTIGRYIYGVFLICYAYTLYHSKEDYRAFNKLVPMGHPVSFVVIAIVAAGGISFLSEYKLQKMCRVLLIVLTFATFFFEGSIEFWWRQKFVEYWNQALILAESVVALGVLMLFC